MMEIIKVEIDNQQDIISNKHLQSHVEFLANELWQAPYRFESMQVLHYYDMSRNSSMIIAKGEPLDGQAIICDSFTVDSGMSSKPLATRIVVTYRSTEKQKFMEEFCKILLGMVK